GIVTLGTLDSDSQVYFQQASAAATPTDFVLTGAVNQAIKTFHASAGDTLDNRTFLKLFVRKKGRTYGQSELDDIGVTTIQTIVNRFPLAHTTDAAITATDAQLVGASPWSASPLNVKSLTASVLTGASTNASTGAVVCQSATFLADGVRFGDTLVVVAGSGFTASDKFEIISVDSETQLTVSIADGDFATNSESTTIAVQTRDIISGSSTGILSSAAASTSNVFHASAVNLSAAGVDASSYLVITGGSTAGDASAFGGVYKVTALLTQSTVSVATGASDMEWPAASTDQLSWRFELPHMVLQQRASTIIDTAASGASTLLFASGTPDTITRAEGVWNGVIDGDTIVVAGTTNNTSCFTVASATGAVLSLAQNNLLTSELAVSTAGASATIVRHFIRDIGGESFAFRWRLFGNGGDASETFQFIQHELRLTSDIDISGKFVARGDITDLLMSFSTPTGTALNMFIDDLNLDDINNVTFQDACGVSRVFPFVSTVTLQFNTNLQNDDRAIFWVFFTNDDAGDNSGRDYGTKDAIIVQDDAPVNVTGSVAGAATFQFSYDYTGNIQRGAASASTDAPVTVVAIGLDTAQFVITTGTITRAKGIVISIVSALERNYSNP
ncbi:MAG: hypothetical protein ACXABY_15270, partial [Candidatus Thorarchaeota archaeon]